MSGQTQVSTLGFGFFSIGLVENCDGDFGFVMGISIGVPVEGTISNNTTQFVPF